VSQDYILALPDGEAKWSKSIGLEKDPLAIGFGIDVVAANDAFVMSGWGRVSGFKRKDPSPSDGEAK